MPYDDGDMDRHTPLPEEPPCIPCSEEAKQAATPPRKAEMDMPAPDPQP